MKKGVNTYTVTVKPFKESIDNPDLIQKRLYKAFEKLSPNKDTENVFSRPVASFSILPDNDDWDKGFQFTITFSVFIEKERFMDCLFDIGNAFKNEEAALIEYRDVQSN